MGWDEVTDGATRSKYLGSWADDPNITLYTRHGTEFFAGMVRDGCPRSFNGMHDYRYMTGPGHDDIGGYVCLEGSTFDSETSEKSCDEFSPLTCRYCGDVY